MTATGGSSLSRLVARLPEPISRRLLVKYFVLAIGCHKPFVRQCRASARHACEEGSTQCRRNSRVLAEALSWRRAARTHFNLLMAFYLYNLLKYRLLVLIWPGSLLEQFQYLDCYLPGRYRYVGRTAKISGDIASVFFVWFLINRLLIHLERTTKFKFFAYEFLLADPDELRCDELCVNSHGTLVPSGEHGASSSSRSSSSSSNQNSTIINTVVFLRSPFELRGTKWILRPNRTSRNWHTLNLVAKFFFYYTIVLFATIVIALHWTLGGPLLTNLGFELSYPACVAWLRTLQAKQPTGNLLSGGHTTSNYSHIYQAPAVLAFELPIDEIPARISIAGHTLPHLNTYNLLRISWDLLENHLVYLELSVLFTGAFYAVIMSSLDVSINAAGIKKRLLRLLETLESLPRAAAATAITDYSETSNWPGPRLRACPQQAAMLSGAALHQHHHLRCLHTEVCPEVRHAMEVRSSSLLAVKDLAEEIANLQAIIADHFDNITRGYNGFNEFTFTIMGLTWFSYTLVICNWMSTFRSHAVEFEFVLAETNITMICMLFLSSAAVIRSRNLQLYPLVTRAMALDPDWLVRKLRWITILKYFHPKPYYCFTVMNCEISWLLCIKLVSWILSAFILLANFFYMHRF